MSWSDNFPVYLANLSPIYIFSVLISILTLTVTILYQRIHFSSKAKHADFHDEDKTEEDTTSTPLLKGEFGGVMGKIKAAKQKALLRSIQGDDISEDQEEQEKRTEAKQIEAIWELLKQQEDKFLLGSKEEMKEQLHLYRS